MKITLGPKLSPAELRTQLEEFAAQQPAAAAALEALLNSALPELLIEALGAFSSTSPTTGLGQVGRSQVGGFLMVVNTLEAMPPCLVVSAVDDGSIELALRQQIFGRSSRNDRLTLFIAGSERAISLRVAADGALRLNNQPIPPGPDQENDLRQKIIQELART